MSEPDRYHVFLSHNNSDQADVEALARRLVGEAKLRPFLDKWHLIPGAPWQVALEEALAASDTVAVFIGPSGISPWHNEEMRAALSRAVASRDEYRVIPVLLPGAPREKVTLFLAARTWVDFRSGLDNDEAFERLVGGIKGEAIVSGVYELPDRPAPYRGLRHFEARHARFFFGRKADLERLVTKMAQHPFAAVVGASGSGKSSLVHAGLLPALGEDALPDSGDWEVLSLTPGSRPLRALAEQLATLAPRDDRLSQADTLEKRVAEREDGLRTAASSYLADRPRPLLLVVDQFEELFTQRQESVDAADGQVDAFVANMVDAVRHGDGRLRVLLAVRADFLGRCLAYPALGALLQDRQVLLGPMDEMALREAVVRPAQEVGALFERGLVYAILRDVEAEPGSLPLLQHALHELWLARRGPWLTLEAYEASGGVRGALERRAQATYEAMTVERQAIARNILTRLTALGEGVSDTRRRVDRAELDLLGVDPGQVDEVLQALSGRESRLVVAAEGAVEVAHEALIQQWGTLRRWLEEDREALRVHRHLSESAEEWEALDQDPGELYRGARLAQALEWAETHSSLMNARESAFIEASRADAERAERDKEAARQRELDQERALAESERQRAAEQTRLAGRLKRFLFALVAVAILALVGAGVAWSQWRVALVRQLTSQGLALSTTRIDTSLLLGIEAARRQPDALAARSGLTGVLQDCSHELIAFLAGHEDRVWDVAFSPDGTTLASCGDDGSIRLWDPASRSVLDQVPEAHGGLAVYAVAYSPNGLILASGGGGGTIRLRDADTLQVVRDLDAVHESGVLTLAFSHDGRQLVSGGIDKRVMVSPLHEDAESELIGCHADWVWQVAFSPDDLTVASASKDKVVKLWHLDASESQPESQTLTGHNTLVTSLALNDDPDRLLMASGDFDGRVIVWDMASWQADRLDPTKLANSKAFRRSVWGLAFSPVDPLVLAASSDRFDINTRGRIKLWRVSDDLEGCGAALDSLTLGLVGHPHGISRLAFSPDGEMLAAGGHDGLVSLWSSAESPRVLRHGANVLSMVPAPHSEGRALVSYSADGAVTTWDSDAGRMDRISLDAVEDVSVAAVSPDGGLVAMVLWEKELHLWRAGTDGSIASAPSDHAVSITHLAFSPDGSLLASGDGEGAVTLWDVGDTLALHTELPHLGGAVRSMVFSPDGQALAIGSGRVHLWDVTAGIWEEPLPSKSGDLISLAYAPAQTGLLAGGSTDGTVVVWELRTRQIAYTLTHGNANIRALAIDPAGRLLAVGYYQQVALYDLATGGQLGKTFGDHDGDITDLAFSADGQVLYSAAEDHTIVAHDLDLDHMLARACRLANRNLTRAEWKRYMGNLPYRKTCPDRPGPTDQE